MMNLKLRSCKHQSRPDYRDPRPEVHSCHKMSQISWVRYIIIPSRTPQPTGGFSTEGYLRSLGSKMTTTLPEIRRVYWTQGTNPISMNLSQYSAGTTLRISSWHLSALVTILLLSHHWMVPLDLRTYLKNKMMGEMFRKTHQVFQQIKVCQVNINSSTRQYQ